jgi:NAD(P)-dependent dehydrogenase (short-subunit alcohol dehydrogenase family)
LKKKVNNAGIYKGASLETLDLSDFDSIMSTNVRSIIVLTKLCLPYLIAQKGSIINNSSINGTCSMAGVLAYSMSKAALDQFTKCLALG